MSSAEAQIKEAVPRNRELLGILAESDYAPPALEQQKRYIADLQQEIKQLDKRITELESKRQKELKDHEKYRDSVMKRFAYKIGGKTDKFEARAEKEEKEYFDVLQEEHKAQEMRKNIQITFDEAKKHKTDLEGVASQHVQAQQDLDALYDAIFQGPTPGFQDEDQKESASNEALQAYHDMRVRTESEGQVVKILKEAQNRMRRGYLSLENARSHSRMDMFGGGAMSDMMERNALSRAEVEIAEARGLVEQARRFSPEVKSMPPVQVAAGNLMSDVFFDNVFTDMQFHEKIKQSLNEQQHASMALDEEAKKAQQRYKSLSDQMPQMSRTLEDARVALQEARETAFEEVARSQG